MPNSHVFISYKHGDPSTKIARHLYDHLDAVSDALDFDLYMDDKDNLGGDIWSDNIARGLKRTTHFIALLDTPYWLSKECRRELHFALDRFERSKSRTPRLLFVKAQEIRPDLFQFDKERGAAERLGERIQRVGDLHFLGPYDDKVQLVRLVWEQPAILSDQIAQLLNRLERVLPLKKK